jgi:hypothetical protein
MYCTYRKGFGLIIKGEEGADRENICLVFALPHNNNSLPLYLYSIPGFPNQTEKIP